MTRRRKIRYGTGTVAEVRRWNRLSREQLLATSKHPYPTLTSSLGAGIVFDVYFIPRFNRVFPKRVAVTTDVELWKREGRRRLDELIREYFKGKVQRAEGALEIRDRPDGKLVWKLHWGK